MKKIIIVLLASALLAACQHELENGRDVSKATLQYLDGTDVKGDQSGVVGKRLQVVTDDADFTDLWAEHASVLAPVPAEPDVDFTAVTLIAAFSGMQRSGGYSVEVGAVTEYVDFVDVIVEHVAPGDGCVTTTALTYPHHMVTIDIVDKPVVFTELYTKEEPCE